MPVRQDGFALIMAIIDDVPSTLMIPDMFAVDAPNILYQWLDDDNNSSGNGFNVVTAADQSICLRKESLKL